MTDQQSDSGVAVMLCQARVAGAQGGYCRYEAESGSDYCEMHAHHAQEKPGAKVRAALIRARVSDDFYDEARDELDAILAELDHYRSLTTADPGSPE